MSTNIITAMEVIAKAPVAHNFDPGKVEDFVIDAQLMLCSSECFGDEFYQAILATQKPATEFDACVPYLIGDTVIYGAYYYEAIQNTTAGELPTDDTLWSITPKFTDANYQELWECALFEYVAFLTMHYAMPFIHYDLSTIGLMKNMTTHSEPATLREMQNMKNEYTNRAEARLKYMHKFLTRVNDTLSPPVDNVTRYPLYPANAEACGKCEKILDNTVNIPFIAGKRRGVFFQKGLKSRYNRNSYNRRNNECCD